MPTQKAPVCTKLNHETKKLLDKATLAYELKPLKYPQRLVNEESLHLGLIPSNIEGQLESKLKVEKDPLERKMPYINFLFHLRNFSVAYYTSRRKTRGMQ